MRRLFVFLGLLAVVLGSTSLFGQGPCSNQSNKLACVIAQEYGVQPGATSFNFGTVLYEPNSSDHHPGHYSSEFGTVLGPLTGAIGRQANLLPVASPSSGVLLSYDPAVKTFVVTTNSLGPILGERGETVGRHKLFVGFSYQFFDFDKIDGVNLRSIPAVLIHTDDGADNSTPSARVRCSTNIPQTGMPVETDGADNLNGCAFVRDRINSVSSVDLKINQYTGYITFGLTNRIDVSVVIPFERVHMGVFSQNTIVPGSDGTFIPAPGSPDSPTGTPPNLNQNNPPNGPPTNGSPYFFHLFKDCPNTSPAGGVSALDANCLNHTFPDPTWIGATFANGTETPGSPSGSTALNNASGIGDIVARVKWNAWSGERLKFASGLDVRFPSGDALNYLGSGSYGVKPFVVLSYRARVSPHVMVGYEWNSNSILSGRIRVLPPQFPGGTPPNSLGLLTGEKGFMPSDLLYSAGIDAWITKWLTGSFDIVGARFLRAGTESVVTGQYLAPCTAGCLTAPSGGTIPSSTLLANGDASYSVTNASAGIKVRPFPKVSKLVLTANVLVRLDDGGLHSKPAPMAGLGYTF